MKTINFRPLRRIKKTGKITVASYMQWRQVMTADYSKFNLIIDDEYKSMGKDELVYNHKGEQLYFFDYNPATIPVFPYSGIDVVFNLDEIRENHDEYGIEWDSEGHVNYNMRGTDCDGVPCFSHYTIDRVRDFCRHDGMFKEFMRQLTFPELTVERVCMWHGWFLWQLNNSYLKIGR